MIYLIWLGLPIVCAFILWPWLIFWVMAYLLGSIILLVAVGRHFAGWFPEHQPLLESSTLEEIEQTVEQGR